MAITLKKIEEKNQIVNRELTDEVEDLKDKLEG
jgi:hypothetical protein